MEVVLLVGGGIAGGAAAFALLPPADEARAVLGGTGLLDRLLAVCARVQSLRLTASLARTRSWPVVANEVGRLLRDRGHACGDGDALALVALAGVGASALAGVISLSPLGVALGLAGTPLVVALRASTIERTRREALAREMPDVFRSLSVSLGSGRTLSQAVEYVGSHERGRAGEEFRRAAMSIRCGASVAEALASLSERLDAPGVELLATALAISQRTGSPLRGLLLSSAQMVEEKAELERSLSTKTAQARLSARIVCVLPALMVCVLSLLSPEFRHGLLTPQGMGCAVVALLLDAVAVAIIRRLMGSVAA